MDVCPFPTITPGNLSVDRLTLLVYAPYLSAWDSDKADYELSKDRIKKMAKMISVQLENKLDPDFPQGFPSELFLHHFRTVDEVDIQFGATMPKRKKVTDESYLESFGTDEEKEQGFAFQYSANEYGFRIEYNPNNTGLSSISPILNAFRVRSPDCASSLRVGRIDLALDYGCKIMPELCLCSGIRKGALFFGPQGIETLYFGKKSSANMFRLYDKKREQLEKKGIELDHDLWRLELECKKAFFLTGETPDFGNIFDRVSFYFGGSDSGDWLLNMILSQSMHYGLQYLIKTMPKNTAIRWRKIFDKMLRQPLEAPGDALRRQFDHKMQVLRSSILSDGFGYKIEV